MLSQELALLALFLNIFKVRVRLGLRLDTVRVRVRVRVSVRVRVRVREILNVSRGSNLVTVCSD